MAELVKPWNDGGSLSVAYDGSGDGSAIFSSDVAEGLDREMIVVFRDSGKTVAVERKVLQEGLREKFTPNDGEFVPSEGGSFNVLKGNLYTEIEYIESTGTQWIDTGIVLTNNHSVEIDYQLTVAKQYRKGIFGGLTQSQGGRFGSLMSPSNAYLEHGYGGGNTYWQAGLPDTNRHVFKQDKEKVYFDGELVHTFSKATFTTRTSAPLGNFNYTNYGPASMKIYSSKWWEDGELIRDFIPVLDKDNVACLYDKVHKEYFYNQGSGTYIAG